MGLANQQRRHAKHVGDWRSQSTRRGDPVRLGKGTDQLKKKRGNKKLVHACKDARINGICTRTFTFAYRTVKKRLCRAASCAQRQQTNDGQEDMPKQAGRLCLKTFCRRRRHCRCAAARRGRKEQTGGERGPDRRPPPTNRPPILASVSARLALKRGGPTRAQPIPIFCCRLQPHQFADTEDDPPWPLVS